MALKAPKTVGYVYNIYQHNDGSLLYVKINQVQPVGLIKLKANYVSRTDLGSSCIVPR